MFKDRYAQKRRVFLEELIYEKKYEPDYSTYSGPDVKYTVKFYAPKGKLISEWLVRNVIELKTRAAKKTMLHLKVYAGPVGWPIVGILMQEYRCEWWAHGSPAIPLVGILAGIAATLAAVGFIIVATKAEPGTWREIAAVIPKIPSLVWGVVAIVALLALKPLLEKRG